MKVTKREKVFLEIREETKLSAGSNISIERLIAAAV